MTILLTCLVQSYDYELLAMAVAICVAGSWTGVKTFIRARFRPESERRQWTTIATLAIASTAWTTHYLGLLAHLSDLPALWDAPITLISLAVMILMTALGVSIGTRQSLSLAPEIGGFVIGLGIAAMHFIGMLSYDVQGRFIWNPVAIVAAVAIALVFGVTAFSRASRPVTRFCKYGGTFALIVAIAGLHFTAMSGLTIVPDPTIIARGTVTTALFGYGVGIISTIMIVSMLTIYELDKKTSRQSETRLRKLANATTEGIVITQGLLIVDVNDRFLAMTGYTSEALLGSLARDLLDRRKIDRPRESASEYDSEIAAADGTLVPIRLVCTETAPGERIYAIRDLRAKRAVDAKLFHLATHDTLTGAFNRSHLSNLMHEMIAARTPFAILYVDIDKFKQVNDGRGHATGDAVLVEFTRRMTEHRPEAIIARIGGDEFALLMRLDADDDDGADALAAVLRRPFMHDGVNIKLGASIGVARFPAHGDSGDALLGFADIAMYVAKAEGTAGVRRYDGQMGEIATRRRRLSQDLTFAAEAGQIELYYQVQTSVRTGASIGFEALARWNHPTLGMIAPDEFIPIAEETGAIIAIGRHVMRRACLDAVTWPDELTVAVNLSPAQFKDDIPALVQAVLAESGLNPARLELEITESLLIQDTDHVLKVLTTIKALGLRIAMDDFGTGYSSLQTLNIFPFDKIKIDRSFVDKTERNPQAAAIVRAVVNLGHSLNIPVLAEGVEKPEHLAYLKQLGCTDAQGYLMGRPTPMSGTAAHMTPHVVDGWNTDAQLAIDTLISAA